MSFFKYFRKRKFIQRAPRVHIAGVNRIEFIDLHGGSIIIVNISQTGIGLATSCFKSAPKTGDAIEGTLNLNGQKHVLLLHVIRVSEAIVGCQIVTPEPDLLAQMNQYFDLEMTSLLARAIDSRFLGATEGGQPHWFQGPNGSSELYFVMRDGQLQNFYGLIWGLYFESAKLGECRYGTLVEDENFDGIRGHPKSDIIHYVPNPSQEMTDMAVRFLENIPQLDSTIREQMLGRLQTM